MKFYIPHKPSKWGFKIHFLVDAKANYLFDAIIASGKNNKDYILTNSENNLTENIVLKLLSKHENKGHRVFFMTVGWYSSIKLVNIIPSKGFQVISIPRRNAKDFSDKNSIDKSYLTISNKEKNIFFISYFYESVDKKKTVII